LVERRGGLLHLTPQRLERADEWFARRGDVAVLIGRVTPVVRSFISIPAGVMRMPLHRYLVLSLIGSAVWAFALAAAGWGVGSGYRHFHSSFELFTVAIVLALVLVVVAGAGVQRRGASETAREAGSGGGPGPGHQTGSMRRIVLASAVVGFAAVSLASAGVVLAAALGGCGNRSHLAATAPATMQATTAPPSAPTTTAASGPGALQAEANAAA